jgi:hypothetical protein
VDLDFKEDQLAIEAHVRMRCGWRDMDEISEEEYLEYAIEYIQENPFAEDVIKFPREAIVYDRLSGEFNVWKRIPRTEIYWLPGDFWQGVRVSIYCLRVSYGLVRERTYKEPGEPSTFRKLGEYFGLVDPAYED